MPPAIDDRRAIASFVLLGTLGVLSFIVQPALVQGFVTTLGLAEAQAVALAGDEMAGVALATILMVAATPRVDWRRLAVAAIAIAAAGNAASALAHGGGTAFAVARFVAGFGHGMLISLSFTFVGLTRRTDRNIALYLVSLLSYGALGIWQALAIFQAIGLDGVFTAFALLVLVGLVTLSALPRSVAMRTVPAAGARQQALPVLVIALAGVLAYNIAQGIAWANLFLIGIAGGLAEQAVADALFLSQILAIGGALAAVFMPARVGRSAPIALGVLGGAASIALLLRPFGVTTFTVAVCGFNILWNMVLPFILAAVSDMDLRGRMMAPAIAMQMLGLGLGPILSAMLIGDGSFRAVTWLCIAGFLVSFVLLAGPIQLHRRALRLAPAA